MLWFRITVVFYFLATFFFLMDIPILGFDFFSFLLFPLSFPSDLNARILLPLITLLHEISLLSCLLMHIFSHILLPLARVCASLASHLFPPSFLDDFLSSPFCCLYPGECPFLPSSSSILFLALLQVPWLPDFSSCQCPSPAQKSPTLTLFCGKTSLR